MSAYDTTIGNKQRCRDLLIQHVRQNIADPVNCFLLPGESAHDARLVQQEFNCRIMGVERDRARFEHIIHTHRWLHVENLSVNSYIIKHTNAGSVQFDFAFLDYVSEYGLDRQREIGDIVMGLLKPTSILALTFQKAARAIGTEKRNSLIAEHTFLEWTRADRPYEDWEKEEINTAFNVANSARGIISSRLPNAFVDVLESFEYRANAQSTTMFFIILRIEQIS